MEKAIPEERVAYFTCVICYINQNGEEKTFEGVCEGIISNEIRGNNGFMYDMIFLYGNKTFAEMTPDEKDKVSHRRRAIDKFIKYIEQN